MIADSSGFIANVKQLDVSGTLALLPAVVCVLLALQWGGTKYAWSSGQVIALFAVGGVLFCVFVAIQLWKGDDATLPPRILKQRSIASAALFSFCVAATLLVSLHSH